MFLPLSWVWGSSGCRAQGMLFSTETLGALGLPVGRWSEHTRSHPTWSSFVLFKSGSLEEAFSPLRIQNVLCDVPQLPVVLFVLPRTWHSLSSDTVIFLGLGPPPSRILPGPHLPHPPRPLSFCTDAGELRESVSDSVTASHRCLFCSFASIT